MVSVYSEIVTYASLRTVGGKPQAVEGFWFPDTVCGMLVPRLAGNKMGENQKLHEMEL